MNDNFLIVGKQTYKTALPELISTTKCTHRCSTKHTCFILGRSNIRFPRSEIEFKKLRSFLKSTQVNSVHYPTAASSPTLPPHYITSQQETLALCHPITLSHSSQLSHFATPLHYPTAANSRTLQPRYITPHQPTLALRHSIQPIIHDSSTTTNSSLPILYT
jgi:hypothetical protein